MDEVVSKIVPEIQPGLRLAVGEVHELTSIEKRQMLRTVLLSGPNAP